MDKTMLGQQVVCCVATLGCVPLYDSMAASAIADTSAFNVMQNHILEHFQYVIEPSTAIEGAELLAASYMQ